MQQLFSSVKFRNILPEKLDCLLGKAYTSCDTLPLYNFIEVVVVGDFKSLVVWGWVRDPGKAWEDIHEEYTTLTKDTKFSSSFRLLKEVHVLRNKLNAIKFMVRHLANRYVPGLFKELNLMGFSHPFTEESYQKDLKKVMIQRKSMILRLKQAQTELQSMAETETASKQDYYDMLSILGKYKGADINPKNYTVMQFISDMNLYKKSNGK